MPDPIGLPELDDRTASVAEHVRKQTGKPVDIGIVLGSGLGSVAAMVDEPALIPYTYLPSFPVPTVEGHSGNLVIGGLGGANVAVMQGRFHHYEGYHMRDIALQVDVLAALGAGTLIVTNASGGIREDLMPGTVMAVTDHINMICTNPLVGLGAAGGADRFVDMTGAYDPALAGVALEAAKGIGINCAMGVLAAVAGPCYETPAEVRMLRTLGADAVCMSTVPEVIAARYLGLRVAGLSLVTNRAAGLSASAPSHDDVLHTARIHHEKFARLVEAVAGGAAS